MNWSRKEFSLFTWLFSVEIIIINVVDKRYLGKFEFNTNAFSLMRLCKIRIENYRSFKDSGVISLFDYTSFIGPNNAGKSNIISAIYLLLSTDKVKEEDWHNGNHDVEIRITGWFDDLKDWERSKPAISPLIFEDGIQIRYTGTFDQSERKSGVKYSSFVSKDDFEYLDKSWGELPDRFKEIAKGLLVEGKAIDGARWKNKGVKSAFLEHLKKVSPDDVIQAKPDWSDNINFSNSLKQGIPNVIFIPAVRDAEDEAKSGANTAMGKILNKIIMPIIRRSPEYVNIEAGVKTLQASLREGGNLAQNNRLQKLKTSLSERLRDMINLEVLLNVGDFDFMKDLGSKFGLKVKDSGQETRVGLQGHGAQRTLLFSLLEQLGAMEDEVETLDVEDLGANIDVEARSVVLLFEEPELFIHPHLLRKLQKILKTISRKDDWQVCITTHSPVLVEVGENPQALILVRKQDFGSEAVQIARDIFAGEKHKQLKSRFRATLDFHPSVCEVFFAKEVILVEGDTELALFAKAEEMCKFLGLEVAFNKEVTVVSCKGKWTIIPFAKILNEFRIPYKVIHDTDVAEESDQDSGISALVSPIEEKLGESPQKTSAQKTLSLANKEIIEAVGDIARVYGADKFIENLLWPNVSINSISDKPFKAYSRMAEILKEFDDAKSDSIKKGDRLPLVSDQVLKKYSGLVELFRFIYS